MIDVSHRHLLALPVWEASEMWLGERMVLELRLRGQVLVVLWI